MPPLSRVPPIVVPLLLIAVTLFAPHVPPMSNSHNETAPPSIILMIGDGMGFNQTKMGRLVEYGDTANLSMEILPEHLEITTYSSNNPVTDSAAAATAIATGTKTNNGMLSLAPNGSLLETILEYAEARNMSTGIVATSEVQHATPAAFMTHVSSRSNYPEITRQIVEEASVDVLMGGGFAHFSPEQLSLMETKGFTIVENRSALLSTNDAKLLGLFADGHIPYELDRNLTSTPSLAEMTDKALALLDSVGSGFFLMVEGSRIDHAAHANDAVRMALEVIAFDEAVQSAMEYVNSHENVILIVTADHETGGFSIVSSHLSSTLPSATSSLEEQRDIRIERAQNVSVSWSTDYHTATNVPAFILRPDVFRLENQSTIDNTDIFRIMQSFLEHFITESTGSTLTSTQQATSISTSTTSHQPSQTESSSTTSQVPSTSSNASKDMPWEMPSMILGTILSVCIVLALILVRFRKGS